MKDMFSLDVVQGGDVQGLRDRAWSGKGSRRRGRPRARGSFVSRSRSPLPDEGGDQDAFQDDNEGHDNDGEWENEGN